MRVIYSGPGDAVSVDGKEFKAGETVTVTPDQYRRIRESDPKAKVEVVEDDVARETSARAGRGSR